MFCGNASAVENSYEFTTSLCKSLWDLHIPTKPFIIYKNMLYIIPNSNCRQPKKIVVAGQLLRPHKVFLEPEWAGYREPDRAVRYDRVRDRLQSRWLLRHGRRGM